MVIHTYTIKLEEAIKQRIMRGSLESWLLEQAKKEARLELNLPEEAEIYATEVKLADSPSLFYVEVHDQPDIKPWA